MKKLMVVLFAAIAACSVWAYTETVNGYTWTYRINGDTAEIYNGGSCAISPEPTGVVAIPAVLGGKPVTCLGDYAFEECHGLTGVTIPDSVTSMDISTFFACGGLVYDTTTIPGVNLLDGWAFNYTSSLSGSLDLTGARGIANHAFDGCSGITSVIIPTSVKRIGDFAFRGCSSLGSATIPGSVASIGYCAFYECTDLAAVTIGNGVRSIDESAFNGCTALASVTVPSSVTSIGRGAFQRCSGLRDVTVPQCVLSVGFGNVFYEVHQFITNIVISADVTSIGDWAFHGYNGLTSVAIPDSVTNIGNGAFCECDNLTSISIPGGVARIGDSAFENCDALASVTLHDGVAAIGESAFEDCKALTFVEIPGSVTVVGESAFEGCDALADVIIDDGVKTIGVDAFCECNALMYVTIPASVTEIGDYAFSDCANLFGVKMPRWFEGNLNKSVFEGCPADLLISYYDPPYMVRFHKNDGSDDITAEQEIEFGVATRLTSLAKLGWAKRGLDFVGWGKYQNSKVVWKQNWASVTDLAASGATVDLYAIWAVASDSYVIEYIRNDGAGTWRWVGFKHGVKTRMPSLANGLKWARRGYEFKGWELTTADANDNTRAAPWKGDWAYVSSPVAKGGKLTAYARWALKPGYYQIRFNRNDDSGKWRTLGFELNKGTKLSTISALGWERDGYEFVGWASSKANADAGKLWKPDGAWVTNAAAEGKTLSIYAIWRKE